MTLQLQFKCSNQVRLEQMQLVKVLEKKIRYDSKEDMEDKTFGEAALKYILTRVTNQNCLKALEYAVDTGSLQSPCVPVKRLDVREIRANRFDKGKTHVLTMKLYRFPWLRESMDVRRTRHCAQPFKNGKDVFCINPFHYKIVEGKPPPPLDVTPGLFVWQDSFMNDYNKMQLDFDANQGVVPNIEPDLPRRHGIGLLPITPMDEKIDEENEDAMDVDGKDDCSEDEMNEVEEPPPPGMKRIYFHKMKSDKWIHCSYFEGNTLIKDKCGTATYFIIDGINSSTKCPERFSLGSISHVHRTSDEREVRKGIQRGIRMNTVGGEIYLENVSPNPVFIQCPMSNLLNGWQTNCVVKVKPGTTLKLFSDAQFSSSLGAATRHGFQSVIGVARFCQFRISFVRGWGTLYRASRVTELPIRVEGYFTAPKEWIDNAIQHMGSPSSKQCASYT